MIVEDGMDTQQILGHTSYLTKIAAFAQDFDLQSVLQYDSIYRRLQSQQGFPWGADSAYLMQKHLKPIAQPVPKTAGQRGNKKAPVEPTSGKEVCFKWNSMNGCNLHACKFAHVCRICFTTEHRGCNHPKN